LSKTGVDGPDLTASVAASERAVVATRTDRSLFEVGRRDAPFTADDTTKRGVLVTAFADARPVAAPVLAADGTDMAAQSTRRGCGGIRPPAPLADRPVFDSAIDGRHAFAAAARLGPKASTAPTDPTTLHRRQQSALDCTAIGTGRNDDIVVTGVIQKFDEPQHYPGRVGIPRAERIAMVL
jgi:hypothetical protein